jgi:hypothetical protein
MQFKKLKPVAFVHLLNVTDLAANLYEHNVNL